MNLAPTMMIRNQLAIALAIALAAPSALRAEPQEPQEPPAKPQPPPLASWTQNVSPAQKQRAQALIEEAYQLHEKLLFEEAAAKYRQALELWDHPAIHFTLGRLAISRIKPIEAYGCFQRAIRFGPQPLDQGDYEQALGYLERLQSQIAEIEVQCDEPGATVLVNGERFFTGPGKQSKLVRPGTYLVEVKKADYFPVTQTISVAPGKKALVAAPMASVAEGTVVERTFDEKTPWIVVGSGVALGLVGAALEWKAKSSFDSFDDAWTDECTPDAGDLEGSPGCNEDAEPDLISDLNRARWENRLAIGAFIAGGAVVLAGVIMMAVNRPNYRRDESASKADFTIQPMVLPGATGLSLGATFEF